MASGGHRWLPMFYAPTIDEEEGVLSPAHLLSSPRFIISLRLRPWSLRFGFSEFFVFVTQLYINLRVRTAQLPADMRCRHTGYLSF